MSAAPARFHWELRYRNGELVKVGDIVSTGTVREIRYCGSIRVESRTADRWLHSPSEIGARWLEYSDGELVYEYSNRERWRAEMLRITGRLAQ